MVHAKEFADTCTSSERELSVNHYVFAEIDIQQAEGLGLQLQEESKSNCERRQQCSRRLARRGHIALINTHLRRVRLIAIITSHARGPDAPAVVPASLNFVQT